MLWYVMFITSFYRVLGVYVGGGSSGRVRGAGKHEIYAATFGGHLFHDLFLQGRGGGDATVRLLVHLKLCSLKPQGPVR